MSKNTRWSNNGEEFEFYELHDMLFIEEFYVGQQVYYGELVESKPSDFFYVSRLLESIEAEANDFSEYAEELTSISEAKIDELDSLISQWLDANMKCGFGEVKNIKRYIITQEDIQNTYSEQG